MKLTLKRHFAAWMLLALFVPMLIISSLHRHQEVAVVTTECADCVQHSCHGHLTQMASWADDCMLCQFLTFTFVATAAVSLIFINKVVCSRIDAQQRNVCVAHSGIVGLRAPPAFSF